MVLAKYLNQGRVVHEIRAVAPAPISKMEQLLAVQTAISQVEGFIQDGNIVLLKLRALLLCIYPRVTSTSSTTAKPDSISQTLHGSARLTFPGL